MSLTAFRVLLTGWSIGFGISVCMSIVFTDALKSKDGREVTGPEKCLVLTVMCVFWFVFFPKAIVDMIKDSR